MTALRAEALPPRRSLGSTSWGAAGVATAETEARQRERVDKIERVFIVVVGKVVVVVDEQEEKSLEKDLKSVFVG